MITNYLRKLLKPIIMQCIANDANTVSNRYIADMKSINKDLYDIRMRLEQMKTDASFYTIHTKIDKIERMLWDKM